MNLIEVYSQSQINNNTRTRSGETKIGEEVIVISDVNNWDDELKKNNAQFVIIGIPEDIGVRANYGRGGTQTAWKPALENILNIQMFFLCLKNISSRGSSNPRLRGLEQQITFAKPNFFRNVNGSI